MFRRLGDFSRYTLYEFLLLPINCIPHLIVCRITICLILKGELLESTTVGDMAHKPAYFVPGNLFLSQFYVEIMSMLFPLLLKFPIIMQKTVE